MKYPAKSFQGSEILGHKLAANDLKWFVSSFEDKKKVFLNCRCSCCLYFWTPKQAAVCCSAGSVSTCFCQSWSEANDPLKRVPENPFGFTLATQSCAGLHLLPLPSILCMTITRRKDLDVFFNPHKGAKPHFSSRPTLAFSPRSYFRTVTSAVAADNVAV